MTEYEHNKCDICDKKFATALGFHKHYPLCLRKRAETFKN